MRTFSVNYSLPGSCDCCGAALPVAPGCAGPGLYALELPEGSAPTTVQIAESLRLTLGGGKLEVRLRQRRGSNRQWALAPIYNSSAFARARSTTEFPEGEADHYWYVFTFELPEYKPTFATWWAEVKFVETPFGARANGGHLTAAHNSPSLSVRLTRLE